MRLIPVCLIGCALFTGLAPAQAQLRGHGGPVRALAVSADGATALSGSFDTSAILWSLQRNAAEQVLRLHDGAVNAVAFLKDGRAVTAGEDARIGIWTPGRPKPDAVLAGHAGPIVALAVSPDGATLASASWDHTIRLWPLAGGAPRVLEGHRQNVNGVAFTPDGKAVVSAGYDATLRIWPLRGGGAPLVVALPAPLNAVAVAPDGEIVAAGADGKVYFLSPDGRVAGRARSRRRRRSSLSRCPATASASRRRASAARSRSSTARRARLARTLAGPGPPVWSAAFLPDNRTLSDRRRRPRHPPLGCRNRRPGRRRRVRRRRGSARRLCRRSGRAGVSRLRRLSYAQAGRGQPRRPDARTASSGGASRRCRATISPRRSSISTSCGRRKRWRSCSRSAPPPTRRAPKCRINASARRRIATPW